MAGRRMTRAAPAGGWLTIATGNRRQTAGGSSRQVIAGRSLAEHCNGGSPAGHWRIIAAGNRWQAMAIEEIQAYEDIRDRRTGCP